MNNGTSIQTIGEWYDRPDEPNSIKSFTFITKVPPVAVLIKKALKIEKGSGKPNKDKVATITKAQVEEIAKTKMEDLNAASLETAMSMVMGTARSMGVVVAE